MSVVTHFCIQHPLEAQIFQDHGLVGACSEGLSEGEKNHGQGVESEAGQQVKNDKGGNVGQKTGDH
ncbi:hypothetical protein ES703_39409 [subsurface metagenome]